MYKGRGEVSLIQGKKQRSKLDVATLKDVFEEKKR